MRGPGPWKRFLAGWLLLATLGAAGGLHHHDIFAGFEAGHPGAARVVSNHDPLSKASHWHAGTRASDDPCLACHVHRFAAMVMRAQGSAPVATGLFVIHAVPQGAAPVFLLGDPTRGPPVLS